MRPRTRVGVVGVGHLGKHHARLLSAMPGAELVAVADLQIDRASAAAVAAGARAVTDYREMLADVDAVTIAAPTVDHLAIAGPFLERGVHVLVEKPMTSTLAEAEKMTALAASSGALLAVGHTERFNPAVQAVLPILKQPRFIEVHRLSGFPERSLDIDVVFDVMIHDLDIILAVDRSPVESVEAIGVPVLTSRVDIANARVRFGSGCVANITASRISRDKVRKVRFFQPDMYVSIDYGAQEADVWRLVPKDGERPAIEGGALPIERDEPLRRELADFIEAIQTGRAPMVTGGDGYRALQLASRVAEQIANGSPS